MCWSPQVSPSRAAAPRVQGGDPHSDLTAGQHRTGSRPRDTWGADRTPACCPVRRELFALPSSEGFGFTPQAAPWAATARGPQGCLASGPGHHGPRDLSGQWPQVMGPRTRAGSCSLSSGHASSCTGTSIWGQGSRGRVLQTVGFRTVLVSRECAAQKGRFVCPWKALTAWNGPQLGRVVIHIECPRQPRSGDHVDKKCEQLPKGRVVFKCTQT